MKNKLVNIMIGACIIASFVGGVLIGINLERDKSFGTDEGVTYDKSIEFIDEYYDVKDSVESKNK